MDTGLVMFHIVTNTFKKSQLSLFPQNRLQLYKRTSLAVHLQFPTMYEDLHSYLSSSNSFSYSCLQYQQTFSGRKIGIAEQGNNPQLQQIPPTKPIGHTYQKKKQVGFLQTFSSLMLDALLYMCCTYQLMNKNVLTNGLAE